MKINIKINKTITIPINCNQSDYNYLLQCNKESARVWNECVRLGKELWESEQKYLDKDYISQRITYKFSDILSSHTLQVMYFKFFAMRKAITMSRKAGRSDVRYPHKEKKYWNTAWDYTGFRVDRDNGTIKISKPIIRPEGTRKGAIRQPSVIIHTKINIPDNIYKVELLFKGGKLQLALNYSTEIAEIVPIQSQNKCGVDMGEIHSVAAIDCNGDKLIITGRKLRSVHRFFNKEQGKLHKKLSQCTKGSNNYWKYRKALQKLKYKTDCIKKDLLHKTSRLFINWCIQNNVSEIYIGDLSQFNMQLKNRKNRKGQKQRLVNWSHGKLLNLIQEKAYYSGIKVTLVSERFTSQTCTECGKRHKPTNRNYVCECGNQEHRDIVGSKNILTKGIFGKITQLGLLEKELKYLHIA